MKSRLSLIVLGLVFSASIVLSQQTSEQMISHTDYLLYLPEQYEAEADKQWPMILFLHGAGERGEDVEKVKVHGPPKLVDQGQHLPFIIVSPQCPNGTWWSAEILHSLLDEIIERHRVDEERIYLTGLSMGGFGTWELAIASPGRFAAIVPICGGGNPRKIWNLRNMPTWVFHGAKDPVVPLSMSEEMVNALKQFNSSVKFTVYPEAQHDSWTESYDNPELYTWFLEHKKYTYYPYEVDTELYPHLAGQYKTADGKLITISTESNHLYAEGINRERIELIPESDLDYFTEARFLDPEKGISFHRASNGMVDRLIVFDEGEIPAERVK